MNSLSFHRVSLMNSSLPSSRHFRLPEESKMVIVSTPNGVNSFHKIWKEAEEGINGFVNVRGYWDEIHTQEWADEQRKLLGDVRFASEVECVFHGSSHTLVDGKKVATIPYKKPIGEATWFTLLWAPTKKTTNMLSRLTYHVGEVRLLGIHRIWYHTNAL